MATHNGSNPPRTAKIDVPTIILVIYLTKTVPRGNDRHIKVNNFGVPVSGEKPEIYTSVRIVEAA